MTDDLHTTRDYERDGCQALNEKWASVIDRYRGAQLEDIVLERDGRLIISVREDLPDLFIGPSNRSLSWRP